MTKFLSTVLIPVGSFVRRLFVEFHAFFVVGQRSRLKSRCCLFTRFVILRWISSVFLFPLVPVGFLFLWHSHRCERDSHNTVWSCQV